MDKIEITKTVDLKVNQSDLVDLLIEELREDTEGKIIVLQERIKQLDEEDRAHLIKMKGTIKKKSKDPMFDTLQKFCEHNKIEFVREIVVCVRNKEFLEEETKGAFRYKELDLDNARRYKYPLGKLDDLGYQKRRLYNVLYSCYERIVANKIGLHYSEAEQIIVKETPAITKLVEESKNINLQIAATYRELYDAKVQLLNIEFGEKKFKAKFIRASLGKSTEGKALLELLEQTKKGVKLLN